MGRQVVVDIVGDSSKFTKATGDAVSKSEGLTGKLQGIGKGMVIGAGIGTFNLLSDAIGMGIDKLGEARQAFLDDQVSQENLAQSLKNNIPNWDGNRQGAEDYASAQARLGFQDDDVRKSLGQLVGVTHDLSEAQTLNSLAQDIARAKGIDLAQATDIVTKAAEGHGKALQGLGIDIKGAKTAAELLDAAQKNVNGSAETWAATSTGKTAVSQVKVAEAMEKVGGIVDKVAVVILPILADAFSNVVDIVGNVIDALQPLITEVSRRLQPVLLAVGPVAKQIFAAIGAAVKALQPVFAVVFAALGVIISTFVKGIQTGFTIAAAAVSILQRVFQVMGAIVSGVFSAVGGVIRGAINAVIGAVNGVIDAINGIQVHIHVGPVAYDFNGLNIGHIPRLHSGGIVPGPAGSDVLTMLQAGEMVTSAADVGRGGDTSVHIHIDQGAYIDGPSVDALARLIAQRMRLQGI